MKLPVSGLRLLAAMFAFSLAWSMDSTGQFGQLRNLREFGVAPTNSPAANKVALQQAIDWAAPRGAALFLEPSDEPYPVDGGLVLRINVSLIGVHGPVGRGTRHPDKPQPVGSVFRITDTNAVFLTVESATQVRGLQFWYPEQTLDDPAKIIRYPATIQVSRTKPAQGVTLSCLTFYGGNLYAGGAFSSIGVVPATNLAYYDGSSWHAMSALPPAPSTSWIPVRMVEM